MCANSQNIRSFDLHTFRFCGSLEHMPASLEKLIQELNRTYSINDFTILKQSLTIFQGKTSTNRLKLLWSGKQVYPYQLCNTHYEKEKLLKFHRENFSITIFYKKSAVSLNISMPKQFGQTFLLRILNHWSTHYWPLHVKIVLHLSHLCIGQKTLQLQLNYNIQRYSNE